MTELIKPKKAFLPPFSAWLASNIPAVYDNTMSYYEELTSLIKYLECVVLPALNNNAEAVAECQALVLDLKSYVENYFKNLDVQEEINNKLDQMAEDGTLQEIIGSYLDATAIWGFDSVSDMQASTNLIDGSFAKTYGFYAKNDGGGAFYKIRTPSNTDVVDGRLLISIGSSLVAELIYFGCIDVKTVGAKGDGSTDDTDAIQTALDTGNDVFIPKGTYIVNGIEMLSNQTLKGESTTKSVIKMKDNATNNAVIKTKTSTSMRPEVTNLAVDGNKTNNSNVIDGIYFFNESGSTNSHAYINKVRVYQCSGNGITLDRQLEARIINSICNNNDKNGIYLPNTSDATIQNCTCSSNLLAGYYLLAGMNRVVNCKAFYNGWVTPDRYSQPYTEREPGFKIESSANTLTNCHSQENAGHGFSFARSDSGNISQISATGLMCDNNGLYLNSDGEVAPLPDETDPYYDGVYCKHVRRSYIECEAKNIHLSNGGTQNYALNLANGTECGLITFVISSQNQVGGDFKPNDATEYSGQVNGHSVESVNTISWRFLEVSALGAITANGDFPITITKENGYIHVRGAVNFENELTTSINEVGIIKFNNTKDYPKASQALLVEAYAASVWGNPVGLINGRLVTDGSIKIRNRGSDQNIHTVYFDYIFRPDSQV